MTIASTPYHAVVNQELLSLLPANCRHVVDVGCMGGALARAYRERNPASRYTGVEIEPEYAAQACRFCDDVVVGSIEALEGAAFKALCTADCWVFGDILEHLWDPWLLLKRVRESSANAPTMVACLPNAQHWSVLARLVSGNFRYEPSGLLDRTHIRWFTRTTLREMFEGIGYRIVGELPKIHPEPMPDVLRPAIGQLARSAGADPRQAVENSSVYQWVVKATPTT